MKQNEVKKVSYKKALVVAIIVAVLCVVNLVLIFMQAETFMDVVALSVSCLIGGLLYALTKKKK